MPPQPGGSEGDCLSCCFLKEFLFDNDFFGALRNILMPEKKITGLELGLRLFTTPPICNCTTPTKTTELDMSAFLLEEYKGLKADMLEAVKETRALERFALAAVGAIGIWLIGKQLGIFPKGMAKYDWIDLLPTVIALLLPLCLVSFLFWRAVTLTEYIDYLASYLRKVEEAFIKGGKDSPGEGLGWEKWWRDSAQCKSKRSTFWCFWRLLWAVTLIIPAAFLFIVYVLKV
jgi:hypothetical protein